MMKVFDEINDEDFPWEEVDDRMKASLERQAGTEITKTHRLFPIKEKLVAVAKCEANDDALFFCDGKYYVIHLTWATGNSEYPRYTVIEQDKIDDYLRNYEW